jgi:hypothetical protein
MAHTGYARFPLPEFIKFPKTACAHEAKLIIIGHQLAV